MAMRCLRDLAPSRRAAAGVVLTGCHGAGARIDQHGEAAPAVVAELQEQPRGQARRRPGIGLRLVPVGHGRVENMRAETGFGGVAAGPVLVAEQAVQPAIGLAAVAEIVDQLGVAGGTSRCRPGRWRARGRAAGSRGNVRATLVPSAANTSSRSGRSACVSAIGVGCRMVRNDRAAGSGTAAGSRGPDGCGSVLMPGSGRRSARSTFTWAMRVRPARITS